MKTVHGVGCVIYVGENMKDNWELLAKAHLNDLFFHLRSFPSCYVILCTADHTFNNSQIQQAADACKLNTKYKNLKDVYVDYTPVSNVDYGVNMGEVLYRSNRKVKRIKSILMKL